MCVLEVLEHTKRAKQCGRIAWRTLALIALTSVAALNQGIAAPTAPTASNNVATVSIGGLTTIYLSDTTTWTGDVYSLTYTIVTPPQYGTVSQPYMLYDESYYCNYQANSNYVGTDTFTWCASMGTLTSGVATCTITVQGIPPVPANQAAVAVENTPLTINPVYTVGNGFSLRLVKTIGPSHGTITTNGMNFLYTPATNYVGSDSFTWKIAYSNAVAPLTNTATATCSITVDGASATNADWTQWRFDECRSAATPMLLPNQLYLQWRRDVPTCVSSFAGEKGLYTPYNYGLDDIDNCRPVQLGKTLFVSLQANDSVSAYNTDTGAQIWRYYTSGAVRRPPVAVALTNGTNVVIFGCDDGNVYCLNAADGSTYWKFQAAPMMKQAMGFGRLGSVWPVWASPVVSSGKVYFVAGYLPSWGLFGYCLDVASGSVVWCNDGQMLERGSNSALGPLAISTDHTSIYGTVEGRNTPWILSLNSGALAGHTGYGTGHDGAPFYWFIDGTGVNQTSEPQAITAGGQTYTPVNAAALGVSGTVGSMLAGDGKLFVTTTQGSIYCFGGTSNTPNIYTYTTTPLPVITDVWTTVVQTMLSTNYLTQGLALVWGVGSGRLVTELARQAPGLSIVAADPDTNKLMNLRLEMDAAGLSGSQVATLQGNPMQCGFAPYQAAIIASEDVNVAGYTNGMNMVQMLYNCTRPFGGEIWLATSNAQYSAIAGWLAALTNLSYCTIAQRTGFTGLPVDGFAQIRRLGLPDSNMVLQPPFRLIAFGPSGETTASCGFDPSTYTLDPRPLYNYDNYWIGWNTVGSVAQLGVRSGRDLYSWLPETAPMTGYQPATPAYNNTNAQWSMPPSIVNSVYGRTEPTPAIYNYYCCSQVNRYGTLAMSPGRTSSMIDASNYWGALVLPDIGGCGPACFTANGMAVFASMNECACEQALAYTQLGVVPTTDPTDECWVNYRLGHTMQTVDEAPMRRVGVCFGAPGDRYDSSEPMLWTHFPWFGRAHGVTITAMPEGMPLFSVVFRGTATNVYHTLAQMVQTGGLSHAWVAASHVAGMNGLTIPLASPLVALRTATPPVIDGLLNDSCWNNSNRVSFLPARGPFQHACSDAAYVTLRYDATNLYIAGQLSTTGFPFNPSTPYPRYMKVALNSRDMRPTSVILACGELGMASQGIPTNAWQVAYTNISTSPELFQAEMAVPWSALASAGLWTSQLVMNVEMCGAILNGYAIWDSKTDMNNVGILAFNNAQLTNYWSPVYLDASRGAVSVATPHTVRLYFAETEGLQPGQRVFDVLLQGQTVLQNLDVVGAAGGPRSEVMEVFTNISIADHLDIDFTPHAGQPMLSGVEIIDTYTNGLGAHINPPVIPPVAAITASVTTGPAPLAVSFSAQGSYDPNGQIIECAWETGDGRLARGSVLNHVFAEPGTYTVNLLVLDNFGSTAATNVTVTVTPGAPSAFVCKIRASATNGDYTKLSTWNAAIASDLTSGSTIFQVSSAGSYTTNDNGKIVTFNGGNSGLLRWVATSQTPMIAAVANVGGTGTVVAGTVAISSGNTFTISDTGTAAQSLLFTVSGVGNYAPSTDDGTAVTFNGGGVGTLHHINTGNIAYISECRGIIQTGTVTCASGDTFGIATTGSPILTAVAECYNDWPTGLTDSVTLSGWMTDPNHCVTIRPGVGQGHTGMPKGTNGFYTGFAFTGTLTANATPYTRLENIISAKNAISIGSTSSIDRVLGSVTVAGNGLIIANSIGTTLKGSSQTALDMSLYHCTFNSYSLLSSYNKVRAVNCLGSLSSSGFTADLTDAFHPVGECWLSHCVSMNNSATNWDGWLEGNLGNLATQAVNFVNAAAGDYRLAANNAAVVMQGVPGLGADIAGNLRTGPTYAVGAAQPLASGPQITSGPVATPNPTTTNTATSFSVQATDSNTMTYAWTFGDGGFTNGATVTYTYAASGVYTAQVVVSDGLFAVTGSVAVTVSPYIPPVANPQTMNVFAGTTNDSIALSYTYASMGTQSLRWTMSSLPTNGALNYWSGSSYLPVSTGVGLTTNIVYYTPSVSPTGSDSFCWFLSDGITSSAPATCSILINSNAAPIVTNHLNVSTAGAGTGSVTLSPPGGSYTAGTVVTLTAIPATNSTFTGWSGALSGMSNPATLTMNGNYSVTASFGLSVVTFTITASAGTYGTISPSGTVSVAAGGSQTFTITPAAYYAINSVTVDGSSVGTPTSYPFNNVQTNHAINATFRALLAPLGTPLWWLAQYGYASELALDPNGVPVWKDYLLNINPNSPGTGPSYNIVPYAEGFENLNAWGGVYTNVVGAMGWTSVPSGDQSAIVNLVYTNIFTNLPLPSITHTNVLQLNAQTDVLVDSFGSGFDMSSAMLYMDMMMQFVPSTTPPSNFTATDTGTKGGVCVNTNNQLQIYHGVADSNGALLSNIVAATSVIVSSGSWHRVSVALDATATNSANALVMFQVLLDGALVTNSDAYVTGWNAQFSATGVLPSTSTTGTWFRLATTNAVAKKMTALCFTGSGYADDIVVTTVNPFVTSSGTCLLIVTISGNGSSSLGCGPCVSAPLTLGYSTQIVYTAYEWNRISSLASNGVSLPSASGSRFFTQTLANIVANVSNAVVFAQATSAQTGYTNVPTAWLTNWTEEAVHAMQGRDGLSVHDKYLLGLDPTSSNSYQLAIDSLSVSGSNLVIAVKRNVTGALAPGGMNGSLIMQGTPTLAGGGFTNIPGAAATGAAVFDGSGHKAFTNAVDGATKFYQAVIE